MIYSEFDNVIKCQKTDCKTLRTYTYSIIADKIPPLEGYYIRNTQEIQENKDNNHLICKSWIKDLMILKSLPNLLEISVHEETVY